MKPVHKFFDRVIENDLNSLFDYLTQIQKDILYKNVFNVPEEKLSEYNEFNGAPTQLGGYYNIFNLEHEGLRSLRIALKEMAIEASEYYGYSFDEQDYYVHGWFNLDHKTEGEKVSPLSKPNHFHDHSGGMGSPYLHGYYCVNAEPSSTFYKIDNKEEIFENINKNNRAIVSETGHPHGRDDWYEDKPRITIAYDITPRNNLGSTGDNQWIQL